MNRAGKNVNVKKICVFALSASTQCVLSIACKTLLTPRLILYNLCTDVYK